MYLTTCIEVQMLCQKRAIGDNRLIIRCICQYPADKEVWKSVETVAWSVEKFHKYGSCPGLRNSFDLLRGKTKQYFTKVRKA